jgi:oligoribonuclease NrnB/cAMP/cGMP phosphodiesterase (DHH superfamily)
MVRILQLKRASKAPKASLLTKANPSNMMKMNQWVDRIQTFSNSTKVSTVCNTQNEKMTIRSSLTSLSLRNKFIKFMKSIKNMMMERSKMKVKVLATTCFADLSMGANVNATTGKTQMNIQ